DKVDLLEETIDEKSHTTAEALAIELRRTPDEEDHVTRNYHNGVIKILAAFETYSTTLMIRLSSDESKIGTSFSNPGNAHFVIQLIVQAYRQAHLLNAQDPTKRATTLIITPYAVQKSLYDILFRNLTPARPPECLEVRTSGRFREPAAYPATKPTTSSSTTGSAQPREVSSIILIECRWPLSRARIGTIMISPGKDIFLAWPLTHLVESFEEHEAMVDLKDNCYWYLVSAN
ncbi:hypothetical protein FSARC_11044, partial [Fusarium sarcochroum]